MINEVMAQVAANNSAIREMFEEGNRLRALFGPDKVFDFSLGNPYFPPPESVKTAVFEILNNMEPNAVHGYMANDGFPDGR